jgi:tellurite resistance protein TehA-like permease
VAARDAGGFPNHSQKLFYVLIPIGMVVLALVAYALSRRSRLIPYVAVVLEILVLIAAIPFALVYGGGV